MNTRTLPDGSVRRDAVDAEGQRGYRARRSLQQDRRRLETVSPRKEALDANGAAGNVVAETDHAAEKKGGDDGGVPGD